MPAASPWGCAISTMLDPAALPADVAVLHMLPGAGPELVTLLGIVDQRAEERRLQRFGILGEAADQIAGDEFRRFFRKKHIAVNEVEHLDRHVLEALPSHQKNDRHFQPAPAHEIDEGCGLALQPFLAPVDHEAADGGVGLHGHFGVLDTRRADDLKAHPLDGGDDFATRIPSRSSASKVGAENRNVKRWTKFMAQICMKAERIQTCRFG